jgi:hypothetical protein
MPLQSPWSQTSMISTQQGRPQVQRLADNDAHTPSVNQPSADMVAHTSRILQETGALLGLNERDCRQIAQAGMLLLNDRLLTVAPVTCEGMAPTLQITLVTNVDSHTPGQRPADLLPQAPGLLAVYRAALGLAPTGHWLIHRNIDIAGMSASSLLRDLTLTLWLEPVLQMQTKA